MRRVSEVCAENETRRSLNVKRNNWDPSNKTFIRTSLLGCVLPLQKGTGNTKNEILLFKQQSKVSPSSYIRG